jgi:hypothetical protein
MEQAGTRRRWILRGLVGVLMVVGAVPLLLFVFILVSHFGGRWRFERHSQEWKDVVARDAPAGTDRATVERLLAARGVILDCRADGNVATCRGTEDKRFGMLPEWFLRFTVTFEDGRLARVEQTGLGIGL